MECKDQFGQMIIFRHDVLIETLWNVKTFQHCRQHFRIGRINRNIMECKEATSSTCLKRRMGINRNIMECKVVRSTADTTGEQGVLIETLWNVKNYRSTKNLKHINVLIETLWNVKIFAFGYFCHQAFVLIETLWNVKLLSNPAFHVWPPY